jgi:hypothetical protein
MLRRALILLGLAITAVAPAAAAEPRAPLRTLVYTIAYSTQARNEERTSGFTSTGNAVPMGNASIDRTADVNDDGTLTIDVVAATNDGGLVVDAAFAGKTTTQPGMRVAIFSDGRLSYDPRQTLSAEAARVLPLLARGLIAGRDISPGSTWSASAPFGSSRGTMTYRVKHVEGERVDLTIQGTITVPGPRGFSEVDEGSTTYATDRLCPIAYELDAHSRHQPSAEQYVTESAHLSARLVSDSFEKRAP